MKRKIFYEAPESELIVVRFEGNFCTTSPTPTSGTAGEENEIDDQGSF